MSTPQPATDPQRDEEAGLPARQRPRSSISSFLFLSFLLFMLTNNNGDGGPLRNQYVDALASLEWQLGNYSAWLNGTDPAGLNFTMPIKPPAEERLVDFFVSSGKILDPSSMSYFPNVTGFIRGSCSMHNITSPAMQDSPTVSWETYARDLMTGANLTEITERLGSWNWTASEKVTMSVVEKIPESKPDSKGKGRKPQPPSDVAMVHGKIEFVDSNTAEEMRFDFEGIHFLRNGSMYGLADPSGHAIDIRTIPSLVPESVRNQTAHIVEPELESRVSKLKKLIDSGTVDDTTSDDSPKPACPFSIYAQLEPTHISEEQMRELEEELQHPTGATTVRRPKFIMHGVLLSRECGIMYEVKNTEGLRSRTFYHKITTYAGFSGLVYLALLLLLSRQMAQSQTPAALARISRWTFFGQALADSISFAGHITFAILADGRPSLSLVAPAFLACALFAHEVQFALLIHQVQAPEDVAPSPAPPPPAPTPTPTIAVPPNPSDPTAPINTAATLPAPPAPRRPSFVRAVWDHLRIDSQVRTWVVMFLLLTFVVRIILAPSLALMFFAALYSSFWVPQIVRAAQRGRTCALDPTYLVGTTIGRLLVAMYFMSCPKNVLDVTPRPWMYLLAIFMFAQVLVLILQDALGPSFFLPQRYSRVQTYDYHPQLPAPDSEAPENSLGDCAICMDAIRLERQSLDGNEKERSRGGFFGAVGVGVSVVGGSGNRKNYSLAPCHHLFHTECLERWLAIKNICPQCRRPLPPL